MAILTDANFKEIREIININPAIKAELKFWPLSKANWKLAFQASEDWFVNGFNTTPTTSYKSAITAITGAATNAQVKALASSWIKWSNKVL